MLRSAGLGPRGLHGLVGEGSKGRLGSGEVEMSFGVKSPGGSISRSAEPLWEAVPNFSVGRDLALLDELSEAMSTVPGARLLNRHHEHDTNRSVFTLMGDAEALSEALFRGISTAARRIDMRHHSGTHPRMGAADVVPFVPWGERATMRGAVELARRLGERVGEELGLPGWFYGHAASDPARRLLHDVRRGGFEALEEKLAKSNPDFGPGTRHQHGGAVAIGARGLLVAFNLTLEGLSIAEARSIAREVREFRRVRRDASGAVLERQGGGLEGVRAIGWWSARDNAAQVTTNITRPDLVPPHVLFAAVEAAAKRLGGGVRGGELVGMIPEALLVAAGEALGGEGHGPLERGVSALKLDAILPFDPDDQVIERVLGR